MKTPRTAALPHFYTQVIGSLPRPALVRDTLLRKGEFEPARFTAVMDDMIRFAIRLQEQAGLDVVSDGEWRRIQYVNEFLDRVGGFPNIRKFQHAGETKLHRVVTEKIKIGDPVFTSDARFLVANTDRCTKFALPSPFLVAIRYWHQDFSAEAYPTPTHLMEDLAKLLRREAEGLVEAGIDIVQLDDPALTYFCDRKLMGSGDTHDDRLRREWDIDRQFPEAVAAINHIVDGLRAEVHLHCCHSVYKRNSDVTGDYKPILPYLKDAHIDRINLEFAYKDTGDIGDLELLPVNLGVGMGVVDVRSENLQSVEAIEAIGAGGAAVLDPARIALNPDCGFAPDFGEPPSIDEAYEKLSRLCLAAKRLRERFPALR